MINNDLRIESYRARLGAVGRVQIPAFLQESSAERLRQCLSREVPWEPGQRSDRPPLLPSTAQELSPPQQDRARLMEAVRRAMSGFEFFFDRFKMIEARRDGMHPELVLHVVVDFLNSPQFIEFAQELTGDRHIRMVTAIAARYRPGHFLNLHNDKAGDEDRAFAYVINLGKDWQSDWGGLLQFVDGGNDVVETFTPHWNSLSLFRVPQLHQVSLVAPWAKQDRLSITGWFRRN